MLKDIGLQISYSSDSGNIVKDFYVPCMKASCHYRRAVGYFTSHGLSVAAKGIAHLLLNGGKIQLIASPCLTDEDIEAIDLGHRNRADSLFDVTSRTFREVETTLIRKRLAALAWLIEVGALDVKLAIRVKRDGSLKKGIFHEKMGIFSDNDGEHVAFSGSPNETTGGLIENYECIDVFWSWDDSQKRVRRKIDRFDKLWSNATPGLDVMPFTDASRELLKKYKVEYRPQTDPEEEFSEVAHETPSSYGGPFIPVSITLRDYQLEGIQNWFKNNGKGTFRFATGTGKTITALGAAASLYNKGHLEALIIVCPFKHLVSQWAKEARNFGMSPILAFESRGSWEETLTISLLSHEANKNSFISVITTNKTFSESFQTKIPHFPKKTILIADEAHNLGARRLLSSLPESIQFRLALSATPERWYDPEGTEALFRYFGPVLEPQIGLKKAIQMGVLTPYRYYPILVELTAGEGDEYLELSEKIARLMIANDDEEDGNPALTALLTRRSRLIASAANKLDALRALMETKRDALHMLVYCGDGRVDDPATDEEQRQIEAVCKLLGRDMGIRIAPFIAETELEEREDLKRQLERGQLQALVAIRCLDEGVDVPVMRSAIIMASSRNPRQFIQRRGRILRKAPGKDAAEIYDMIVCPPSGVEVMESERTLLRKEIERFTEFADIALNAGEAKSVIHKFKGKYRI